jgi:glycosyltransferase involved in cell wall biosynthesis
LSRGESDGLMLNVLLGLMLSPRGPSYTMVRLVQGMIGDGLDARVFAPVDAWRDTGIATVTGGIGSARIDPRLPYRLFGQLLARRSEKRLLEALEREGGRRDIVFTWGEVSLDVSRALQARGIPVVREKYNCAKRVAKDILDGAYARFGVARNRAISEEMVDKENAELPLADAIFCPSPKVAESLLAIGIAPERLIETSYGWEPARFAGTDKALAPVAGPTLIFVGSVCIRKGAHILLEAWRRANIKGRLVLAGEMEPLIERHFGDVLARDDVLHFPYTDNVGALYRSVDWFIFPTLEEGSPLVTYEAAACGLPLLVSPMGAGPLARDGSEGVILDSDDPQRWAELIATLPDRGREREEFAQAARARSLEFTYDKVGARRRAQLLERFGSA